MALTPCAPCNCIPGNEVTQTYHQKIRQTLCEILAASGGGGAASAVNNIPAVEVLFGAITNAYVATTFLAADAEAREIAIFNNTNAVIQLSYDGVAAGPIIPPGVFRQIDFAANGRVLYAADIFIKYVGAAPTLGSVVFDGFY
jgi:hypothetical protein